MSPEIQQRIEEAGIVAVLIIDELETAVPLARTLYDNGIRAIELTLRTPVALEAASSIISEVPEMLTGIGTILTTDQVDACVAVGAAFGVSPGLNRRVLHHAREQGFPFGPGIATPSEIEQAIEEDCRLLKYFPAETLGGLPHLRNMAAPYRHLGLKFIPLGGINATNAGTYLKEPLIAALGGSWLAPREAIKARDWDKIGTIAQEAAKLVKDARS